MFLKIGHRGARTYETENTIKSFGKAIDLGANALELDVRLSGDSQLVVSHDDNLKKVYGEDINIGRTSLAELKQLTDNRIAGLEEALRFIDKKAEKILVELKEPGYEKQVLDLVRALDIEERIIIVSFHEKTLALARQLHSGIETGLIFAKFSKSIETALKFNAQYLVALYRFIHRRDIAKAHKSGLKVIAWTVNTKIEIQNLIAKDVDGIATDKPALFKGLAC